MWFHSAIMPFKTTFICKPFFFTIALKSLTSIVSPLIPQLITAFVWFFFFVIFFAGAFFTSAFGNISFTSALGKTSLAIFKISWNFSSLTSVFSVVCSSGSGITSFSVSITSLSTFVPLSYLNPIFLVLRFNNSQRKQITVHCDYTIIFHRKFLN